MGDSDLQRRLEKLGAQLVHDIERWEQRTRGDRQRVMEDLTHTVSTKLSRALEKLDEKEQRRSKRREKEEARELKRLQRARRDKPSALTGAVALVAAVFFAVFAVLRPDLWWMVFIALGIGASGARELASASRARAEEKAAEPVAPQHEVDTLCEQLLADLAASPEAVRQFISAPEKTVASMRTTLKALDARRQQLLHEDAPGKLAEVQRRRAALVEKRDRAADAEARKRLGDAIEGTDGQVAALKQLAVVTERVDGEYTALLVRLQELKTRVSVARSSSTQVQLDGVRGSVNRLNEELGAISEAMTHLEPVVEVVSPSEREDGGAERRVRG